ncbi:CbiX/SirB N-terminal domain-containing protein, partial [Streptomyces sp. SID1034]
MTEPEPSNSPSPRQAPQYSVPSAPPAPPALSASAAPSAPPAPEYPLPLDSTAQLVTRITVQLSSQLSRVRLDGTPTPMTPAARPALVAVAHGSRDPGALRTVTALLERVRELRPGLDVRLGHIEIDRPPLADTLAALCGEAVLVPLLLGR